MPIMPHMNGTEKLLTNYSVRAFTDTIQFLKLRHTPTSSKLKIINKAPK